MFPAARRPLGEQRAFIPREYGAAANRWDT
jgi:hypothetical protein